MGVHFNGGPHGPMGHRPNPLDDGFHIDIRTNMNINIGTTYQQPRGNFWSGFLGTIGGGILGLTQNIGEMFLFSKLMGRFGGGCGCGMGGSIWGGGYGMGGYGMGRFGGSIFGNGYNSAPFNIDMSGIIPYNYGGVKPGDDKKIDDKKDDKKADDKKGGGDNGNGIKDIDGKTITPEDLEKAKKAGKALKDALAADDANGFISGGGRGVNSTSNPGRVAAGASDGSTLGDKGNAADDFDAPRTFRVIDTTLDQTNNEYTLVFAGYDSATGDFIYTFDSSVSDLSKDGNDAQGPDFEPDATPLNQKIRVKLEGHTIKCYNESGKPLSHYVRH